MDADRDELLADDLGQACGLKQALHLPGRVGKDRLDAVGLQIPGPLLQRGSANI